MYNPAGLRSNTTSERAYCFLGRMKFTRPRVAGIPLPVADSGAHFDQTATSSQKLSRKHAKALLLQAQREVLDLRGLPRSVDSREADQERARASGLARRLYRKPLIGELRGS
jgi:hypothetical protein